MLFHDTPQRYYVKDIDQICYQTLLPEQILFILMLPEVVTRLVTRKVTRVKVTRKVTSYQSYQKLCGRFSNTFKNSMENLQFLGKIVTLLDNFN